VIPFDDSVLAIFELVGIFVFAVSGALMAIRKEFDAIGIMLLAEITAIGGGVLRDVLIGATPPAAFTDLGYLLVPVVAAGITFFSHSALERLMTPVLVFDAAGFGLFCVTGTLKALDYGLGPLQAAVLGVTTAVGGGVLRDVVAREIPALVSPHTELYAVPAFAGAVIVVLARRPLRVGDRDGGRGVRVHLPRRRAGARVARPASQAPLGQVSRRAHNFTPRAQWSQLAKSPFLGPRSISTSR
jgi:uncharacterized membrane protein YeiH